MGALRGVALKKGKSGKAQFFSTEKQKNTHSFYLYGLQAHGILQKLRVTTGLKKYAPSLFYCCIPSNSVEVFYRKIKS